MGSALSNFGIWKAATALMGSGCVGGIGVRGECGGARGDCSTVYSSGNSSKSERLTSI